MPLDTDEKRQIGIPDSFDDIVVTPCERNESLSQSIDPLVVEAVDGRDIGREAGDRVQKLNWMVPLPVVDRRGTAIDEVLDEGASPEYVHHLESTTYPQYGFPYRFELRQ